MALRVSQDLGASPPSEEGLKAYVDRELHPVVKAVRRTVNDIVDVTPHQWIDDTTNATEKVVASIEINEDEMVTVTMNARGAKAAGDWVFKTQKISYEMSSGVIRVVLVEMDEEPLYAGANSSLTTATAALEVDAAGNRITASVTGEVGTDIHWTVAVSKLVAFEREKR